MSVPVPVSMSTSVSMSVSVLRLFWLKALQPRTALPPPPCSGHPALARAAIRPRHGFAASRT
eukprot:3662171-Alexandrium_andersonii.AAC.1